MDDAYNTKVHVTAQDLKGGMDFAEPPALCGWRSQEAYPLHGKNCVGLALEDGLALPLLRHALRDGDVHGILRHPFADACWATLGSGVGCGWFSGWWQGQAGREERRTRGGRRSSEGPASALEDTYVLLALCGKLSEARNTS